MNEENFSAIELTWLKEHPAIERNINELLEDSLNADSLDSGEPDLMPFKRAVIAAQITIEVAGKKLITGPYDEVHWQILGKHIPALLLQKNYENTFWELFTFHCACAKEEDDEKSKERIYMKGMQEMIRIIDENSLELFENSNNQVANLDSGTIQTIKGKGVNAKFAG
jgi:hypothetical protein